MLLDFWGVTDFLGHKGENGRVDFDRFQGIYVSYAIAKQMKRPDLRPGDHLIQWTKKLPFRLPMG